MLRLICSLYIVVLIISQITICSNGFQSQTHGAVQTRFRRKTEINVLPVIPLFPLLATLPVLIPAAAVALPQIFDRIIESKIMENMDIDPAMKDVIASRYNSKDEDGVSHPEDSKWDVNVSGRPVFAAKFVSWILRKVVEARTQYISGLDLTVLSESNRHILMGKVSTVDMKFERIVFGPILVSGGGRLILRGLDLRMRRFLFCNLQSLRKPYKVCGDFLLTQSDIVNSKLIRGLLQMLVDLIFKLGIITSFFKAIAQVDGNSLKATVKRVSIRSRRLYVNGEAELTAGSLPFELSTGAGLRENGHVIFLKDIEVVINPDSVLRTSLVIPLSSAIDIDLGDDFVLENFVIANKHLWIRATSDISPVVPFAVTPVLSRAFFRYDMAALLSTFMRIPGGIIRFEVRIFNNVLKVLRRFFPFIFPRSRSEEQTSARSK